VTNGDEIKNNEAGKTSSMHQTNKNCVNFELENLKGRFHLQDLGIDGIIILNHDTKIMVLDMVSHLKIGPGGRIL
jgi:hypothetical protein